MPRRSVGPPDEGVGLVGDDLRRDPAAKLSPRVTERLAAVDARTSVEVVVEMQPVAVPATGSRASRIEAVKVGFEEELRGVAERIAAVGGEVLETAWVNQTLRGSIPAAGLVRVAEEDAVTAIDLPRPLEPDLGTSD